MLIILGSITPFVQPLDMAFNRLLKKNIRKNHKYAPNDDRLSKYFTTRTRKAKAGHIFTIALCLKEVLDQLFPMSNCQSLLKTAFIESGIQMKLSEDPKDNLYLRNVYKHAVNEFPPVPLEKSFPGIDISRSTYEEMHKAGRTPGRKIGSTGLSKLKSFTPKVVGSMHCWYWINKLSITLID